MKKKLLTLMMFFSVIGVQAEEWNYEGITFTLNGNELTIDAHDRDIIGVEPAKLFPPYDTQDGKGHKFSESIFKDVVTTISIKNTGKLPSTMFLEECRNVTTLNLYTSIDEIGDQTFNKLLGLTDVNIIIDNTNNKNDGLIKCALNSFAFDKTVVQTQIPAISNVAQLNIPDGDYYYSYYVGHWKDGVKFTQGTLCTIKDGGTINGVAVKPQNGWQQFAKSGTNQIVVTENFIRTFSSTTSYQIPDGFECYLVTGYDQATNHVSLAQINYIPKNTGVILRTLHENPGVNNDFMTYLVPYTGTVIEYPFETEVTTGGNTYKNYLHKSLTAQDRAVGPRATENGIVYRFFGFSVKSNYYASFTNPKFIRLLKNTTAKLNKAYLKLPESLFNKTNEGINGPAYAKKITSFNNSTTSNEEDNVAAELTLDFSKATIIESDIPRSEFIFIDIPKGVATSIKDVQTENDNKIYNLQGIEVKSSLKGVYIKNGKKYIIK